MGVLYFAGAETGDLGEINQVGTMTIESSVVKSGAYSFRRPAQINAGSIIVFSLDNSTLYFRQHSRFTFSGNPSIDTNFIANWVGNTSAADICFIRLKVTSAGAISIVPYNYITSLEIGSPYSISKDIWYTLELKVVISATVGIIELKVNGSVVCTGSSLNTGSVNIGEYGAAFAAGNLNSMTGGYHYLDDFMVRDDAYPGEGLCIARQGKAGAPTGDTWTKTGGTNIEDVWNDTPSNATRYASSSTSTAVQHMLTASFSSTQTGHGSETIGASDTINACRIGMIAKVATASIIIIRKRLNGVTTESNISFQTSDSYGKTSIFTDTLTNLNSSEMGARKDANTYLTTIEDIWMLVDYTSGGTTPVNVNISEAMV